jgi:hypothetical protein
MKRTITRQEEFEIMKLVLDKFLWLGVLIMGYGFYRIVSLQESFWYGLTVLVCGALLLLLFMWVLVKEYNYMRG